MACRRKFFVGKQVRNKRGCWNWQTSGSQKPVGVPPYEFKSHTSHHANGTDIEEGFWLVLDV